MIYAYIRVSTQIQGTDQQEYGIEEYCKSRNMKIDKWFIEKISGTRAYETRKLGEMMKEVKTGDHIIVTEISRIGRRMTDVLAFIERCKEMKVTLHAIKQSFVLNDSLNARIMACTFAMCAEIERELCSQRIKEKLAAKKARGEKLGRPFGTKNKHSKFEPQKDLIEGWLKEGKTRYYIRKALNAHAHTLNSFLLESGLADKYNIPMTEHFKNEGQRRVVKYKYKNKDK